MKEDDITPDPAPEVAEERIGRRRMWTLFAVGAVIVIILALIGRSRMAHPAEAAPQAQDSVR